MTVLGLIRHGETAWNRAGKMQGHEDVPLTQETRNTLCGFRPPDVLSDAIWHASPLSRATETADILGISNLKVEPRLIETDWGDWQGKTIAELRSSLGERFLAEEGKGIDFRPPKGESPGDVMARVKPFLREIGNKGVASGAVTHKGVIRAVLALAYDWDMTTKAPIKLTWHAAHLFDVDHEGKVSPLKMNVPLETKESAL